MVMNIHILLWIYLEKGPFLRNDSGYLRLQKCYLHFIWSCWHITKRSVYVTVGDWNLFNGMKFFIYCEIVHEYSYIEMDTWIQNVLKSFKIEKNLMRSEKCIHYRNRHLAWSESSAARPRPRNGHRKGEKLAPGAFATLGPQGRAHI